VAVIGAGLEKKSFNLAVLGQERACEDSSLRKSGFAALLCGRAAPTRGDRQSSYRQFCSRARRTERQRSCEDSGSVMLS
jgi:hypothetical protein